MEEELPHSLNEQFNLRGEAIDYPTSTDIVVIRPPKTISQLKIEELAIELSKRHFIPVLLPLQGDEYYRWYPTDKFREIGEYLVSSGGNELQKVLRFLNKILSGQQIASLERRMLSAPSFVGGEFVCYEPSKSFFYTKDQLFDRYPLKISDFLERVRIKENETARKTLRFLHEFGYKLIPLHTSGFRLRGQTTIEDPDLDFLLAVFRGNDDQPHAIIASSFAKRMVGGMAIHLIPDAEALRGGCNIADLRQGEVLVVPNRADCPTTYHILMEHCHQKVHVIETPPHFLDGGGGPRCSICSFSLK